MVKAAKQLQRFSYSELLGKLGFLQGDADSLPQGVVFFSPAAAQQLHLARGRREQPFQNLDGGGFSRSVRSEQAKALPRPHFEVQPVDCVNGPCAAPILLAQVFAANGDGHWESQTSRLGRPEVRSQESAVWCQGAGL